MTKKFISFVLLLFPGLMVFSQTGNLPVKEWTDPANKPFILYISGDGGFNNFSTGLCNELNRSGYNVTAINAKTYFWEKRTPEQSALDIASYLDKKMAGRNNQQLVLAGYSFGADVLPFIVNKLPEAMKKKLVSVVLLSPSTTTDFEIHWADILGISKKRSMDVVAEINRMGVLKTVTIIGSDEDDFPLQSVKLTNYYNEILNGDHHYEGDIDKVAKTIIKYIN